MLFMRGSMKIIKGDLIKLAEEGNFDVIIHGCNCFNTMGAGIAVTIARKFPHAYEVDKNTVYGSKEKLGTYTYSKALTKTNPVKQFYIINAYTQYTCWKTEENPNDLFEYEAFQSILDKLYNEYSGVKYGFPLIGCGLAGGNKDRILTMIKSFSDKVTSKDGTVTVVEYSN